MHWTSNYLKWIIVLPLASAQYYQRSSLIPGTNPRINSPWDARDARPKSPYRLYQQGVPFSGGVRTGQPQYGQPQYGQPQYGQPQYGQPQYGHGQHGQPHSSSGYGGHSNPDKSQIFPYYIQEYFKFRSHLNVAMNRIENADETMAAVENDLMTAEVHLDAIKVAIEGLPDDTCSVSLKRRGRKGPDAEAFMADNRCFELFANAVPYEDAVTACIRDGGTLATPSLHPDSQFGAVFIDQTNAVLGDIFWIGGFSESGGNFVMRNGYVIDANHPRWMGAPGSAPTTNDQGLTVVLAADGDGNDDFEISSNNGESGSTVTRGYVCEFKPFFLIPVPGGGTLTAHAPP